VRPPLFVIHQFLAGVIGLVFNLFGRRLAVAHLLGLRIIDIMRRTVEELAMFSASMTMATE